MPIDEWRVEQGCVRCDQVRYTLRTARRSQQHVNSCIHSVRIAVQLLQGLCGQVDAQPALQQRCHSLLPCATVHVCAALGCATSGCCGNLVCAAMLPPAPASLWTHVQQRNTRQLYYLRACQGKGWGEAAAA